MRVGVPHIGNLYIPLKALARRLGIDLVVPPATTQHTLSLGVKYSPEALCIPFKLTLGNMIEAAEMGADTLLMAGGYGICRLGYYARTQEQILRDLGFNVEVMRLGVSQRKFLGFLDLFKRLSNNAPWPKILSGYRFGMAKLNALDRIEKIVQKARPVEREKGTANRIYSQAVQAIDEADDHESLRNVEADYASRLYSLPQNGRVPLVVGLTGEFYVLLEPFSNLDVESELGKLGVEVRRSTFISEWTKFSLFFGFLKRDRKRTIHRAAMPYLKRDIGGDGWESVGEKVLFAREGYDGLIHLAPFTCMPEIVAQNIMPTTREHLPVLTLYCDEQMGKAGVLTRLEAFVDLLERKRQKRNGGKPLHVSAR